MILSDFNTSTHGKWILAGEHAVLRGHPAIVYPIMEREFRLEYKNSDHGLGADYAGDSGADMHLLFWSVLEQGMHLIGKSLNSLQGKFHLYSNIPIGVGMGASASLCAATARWFSAQGLIAVDNSQNFARELENLFHGKSSGLDIAGVSSTGGIYFKNGQQQAIQQSWQPNWQLSSCGQIGITSHCIQQVNQLWENKPRIASDIDEQMADSVEMAVRALSTEDEQALCLLAKSINQAGECFKRWGLISESLEKHIQSLKSAGALAVKPTGSGGAGNVLSLWRERPTNLDFAFIDA